VLPPTSQARRVMVSIAVDFEPVWYGSGMAALYTPQRIAAFNSAHIPGKAA
jgi:hypothetical protein